MTKGEEIWLRRADGELAQVRVDGTSTTGVRATWLTGVLTGREALIDRERFAAMAAAAKRGRA